MALQSTGSGHVAVAASVAPFTSEEQGEGCPEAPPSARHAALAVPTAAAASASAPAPAPASASASASRAQLATTMATFAVPPPVPGAAGTSSVYAAEFRGGGDPDSASGEERSSGNSTEINVGDDDTDFKREVISPVTSQRASPVLTAPVKSEAVAASQEATLELPAKSASAGARPIVGTPPPTPPPTSSAAAAQMTPANGAVVVGALAQQGQQNVSLATAQANPAYAAPIPRDQTSGQHVDARQTNVKNEPSQVARSESPRAPVTWMGGQARMSSGSSSSSTAHLTASCTVSSVHAGQPTPPIYAAPPNAHPRSLVAPAGTETTGEPAPAPASVQGTSLRHQPLTVHGASVPQVRQSYALPTSAAPAVPTGAAPTGAGTTMPQGQPLPSAGAAAAAAAAAASAAAAAAAAAGRGRSLPRGPASAALPSAATAATASHVVQPPNGTAATVTQQQQQQQHGALAPAVSMRTLAAPVAASSTVSLGLQRTSMTTSAPAASPLIGGRGLVVAAGAQPVTAGPGSPLIPAGQPALPSMLDNRGGGVGGGSIVYTTGGVGPQAGAPAGRGVAGALLSGQAPPPGYVRAVGPGGQVAILATHRGGHLDPAAAAAAAGRMGPVVTMNTAPGVQNGADTDDSAPVKENTGRWTYDEHRLFLRGLELHGKGWKKIASLIKTRTVVQIRTHAQKYFQKIAKAKQNGEHGEVAMDAKGKGMGRKSRGRRRMEDLLRGPTAVAPSLQPYVAGAGAVETGLYRFLSPITIQDVERPPSAAGRANGVTGNVGGGATVGPVAESGGRAAGPPSRISGAAPAAGTPADAASVLPPNWYRAGRGVDDLLNEAEGLDWLADSGGLVGPSPLVAANLPKPPTTSTAPGLPPSTAAAGTAAAAAAAEAAAASAAAAAAAATTAAAAAAAAAARPKTPVPAAAASTSAGTPAGTSTNVVASTGAAPLPGGAPAAVAPHRAGATTSDDAASKKQIPRVPANLSQPFSKRVRASESLAVTFTPTVNVSSTATTIVAPSVGPATAGAAGAGAAAAAAAAAASAAVANSGARGASMAAGPAATIGETQSGPSMSPRSCPSAHPLLGGHSAPSSISPVPPTFPMTSSAPAREPAGPSHPAAAIAQQTALASARDSRPAMDSESDPAARTDACRPSGGNADEVGRGEDGFRSGGDNGVRAAGPRDEDSFVREGRNGRDATSADGSMEMKEWTRSPKVAPERRAPAASVTESVIPPGSSSGGCGDGDGVRGNDGAVASADAGNSAGVAELTPSGLQGSDAEDGHLSGLSDLGSLIDDQEFASSPPFGAVSNDGASLARGAASGTGGVSSAVGEASGAKDATSGMGPLDEGLDEDAFVAALLDT